MSEIGGDPVIAHLRLGYLVNSYPMPSLTFIRREIAALEDDGATIVRYAVRDAELPLVDPADRLEYERTKRLLDVGLVGLLWAMLSTAGTSPRSFLRGLNAAVRLALASERGLPVHIAYLAEACLLRRWAIDDRVEHIHTHFAMNAAAVAMLSRIMGGPTYSLTVHGPEEFDAPSGLGLRQKVAHAKFVAAISSYARSQIWRWADPADWGKVEIVRCGVDDSFLNHKAVDPPDEPVLLTIGRLAGQKGQLVLIDAAAILARRGRRFHLRVIGDGELREQIEIHIADAGLEEFVELMGWRSGPEVRAALEGSRALVLSSFAEGLPVVIMEAFALERPVVSTAIAGIPELVRPGESGWLVPAGSAEALADALEEVLDTPPATLRAMGARGAAQVAIQHDVRREARRIAELCRGVPR